MKRARYAGEGDSFLPGRLIGFSGGTNSYENGGYYEGTPSWMYSELPEEIASDVVYNAPVRGPKLQRMEMRLETLDSGSFATNGANPVKFRFPNVKPIDLRGGFLMFTVTITTTGGTYKRLSQGVWSIFNNVRIRWGAIEDELQYYNRMFSFRWNSLVPADVQSTIGFDLLGLGLQSDRNGWGAVATDYVMPFDHAMLRKGIIPMHALHALGGDGTVLQIEFTLDMPSMFVETDGTNPQVQITNARWHYYQVTSCNNRFENALSDLVASGKYKIGFETTTVTQNPVLTQNPDIIVSFKGSAVNDITTIFVDASTQSNTLVNDKFITWPKTFSNAATVLSYQMQFNETWWPQEAVTTSGDAFRAYIMYLNKIGIWHISGVDIKFGAPIGIAGFNLDQFMMTIDMRALPKYWLHKGEIFNMVSLRNECVILLRLVLSAPPPPQLVVYHMINNNVLVKADSKGNLTKFF